MIAEKSEFEVLKLVMEGVCFDVFDRQSVSGSAAWFKPPKKRILNNIDLSLVSGRIHALVGESGSGKSTIAKLLTGLLSASQGKLGLAEAKVMARTDVQMVFQNPFDSLNPVHSVLYHLQRPLKLHRGKALDVAKAVRNLLQEVGLDSSDVMLAKLPHELSGGQRQRLSLARAMAVRPKFIIADEPTSMLDASVRLEVLNLFRKVAASGIGILFITHDLATARYLSDDISILYQGEVVERGFSREVLTSPKHDYTKKLLNAFVDINTNWQAEL